ncbi:hypothetical protein B0T22DRAFT_382282 [Podospora appendiculata]|uniref:Methyltransferase domain-containing protein n=1 Tax=Podospora appendiculata TaxID=314037 RepID=A0AAE0X5S9_9PEZI|nr:hypothetical protein B0T22DRAFT_382282 [Podospora appendiculata]
MEFLSGFASARAPLTAYQVEPHPQSQRANRPTRSNSTSGAQQAKRRSRVSGHIRTSSASTTSSSHTRAEIQAQPVFDNHPNANANEAQTQAQAQALANPDADPDSALTPTPTPTPTYTTSSTTASTSSFLPSSATAAGRVEHRIPRRDLHRERMPASTRYYNQNKQLPATPRLDTFDVAIRFLSAPGSTSEPASARTPASASATAPTAWGGNAADRRTLQHAAMAVDPVAVASSRAAANATAASRSESVSSISGATTVSNRTMLSSEPPSSAEFAAQQLRPFVVRNGRTYISDQTLPYPLPVDLEELHRQSLRTLLLIQLFGGPICSPAFASKPPKRVLEVGCGSGFWSMMCYRHYESQGQQSDISFTGIDIAPIAPGASGSGTIISGSGNRASASSAAGVASADGRPAAGGMNWRFVQHDLRRLPWPFQDGEFDLVMVKDMSLATTTVMQQTLIDEYLRILTPGGTIEMWESDHTLRMLRPHVPEPPVPLGANVSSDDESNSSSSENEQKEIANLGAYVMTANTPLSAPLNNFLVEYNGWVLRALEKNSLSPVPCTVIGPLLVQEAEILTGVESRRLAVPLSEVRWEREGVGGVVTKDGKSYIETKGRRGGKEGVAAGKALEPGAAALRRTALLTVVQMIQSLEHVLREVSGKSQDEWDAWLGKMMIDLVRENGTSWGECLEVGAWWARKRVPA